MNAITIMVVRNGYTASSWSNVAHECHLGDQRVFETLEALVTWIDDTLERPKEGPDAIEINMPETKT